MQILGLIPARGGSKGIPQKNLKKILGVPLIGYTIQSALGANSLTRVLVTTDDKKICKVAKEYGVDVIDRPNELSNDLSPMIDVVAHAIEQEEKIGNFYDFIVLLQPTAPLRNSFDIENALNLIKDHKYDSLISVYQVSDAHPIRMYRINNNIMLPIWSVSGNPNRQMLPPVYHRNGAIYIFKPKQVKDGALWGKKIAPYIMSREKSINIDEPIDLDIAKILIKKVLLR